MGCPFNQPGPACALPFPGRPKVNAVFLFVPLPIATIWHAQNVDTPQNPKQHGALRTVCCVILPGGDANALRRSAARCGRSVPASSARLVIMTQNVTETYLIIDSVLFHNFVCPMLYIKGVMSEQV